MSRQPDILSLYAEREPDKPAVIDDRADGTLLCWSFAELNAEANRLARVLQGLGVGRGDKVVWCG
ncbi:MAG: AMP-binding protein, partial [Myxococcota bacterium]